MTDEFMLNQFGNTDLSDGTEDRPLVTFALFAYNQEKYVRDAIEGAFAQTYSPLEIILSDDCSTDSTPMIMQEMAASYTGPHSIVVRSGLKNLGTFSHVLSVAEIARGEIIVVAAGDDISLPERTELSVSRLHGSDCIALSGNEIVIDSDGVEQDWDSDRFAILQRAHEVNPGWVGGGTAAYKKQIFQLFKTPHNPILFEDVVISDTLELLEFKSILLKDALIKYRKTEENVFNNLIMSASAEDIENDRIRKWKNYFQAKNYVMKNLSEYKDLDDFDKSILEKQFNQLNYFRLISNWPHLSILQKFELCRYSMALNRFDWALPRLLSRRLFFLFRRIVKGA